MSIPWNRVRITHLSRKGQLTTPAAFIRDLALKPGRTWVAIMPVKGGVALVPTTRLKERDVSDQR